LTKTQVANGIYWVEARDADLRVLCGCPADAVKHLARRGLIATQEQGGTTAETGPNAILLSDVLIQNGQFANLAEFPVLQMLYRQGMGLPGPLNNIGRKPILMGSARQLRAQMRYIHRGNYGLTSEEELIQSGASPEAARDMVRLKKRFAFGNIRSPEELVDRLVIGNVLLAFAFLTDFVDGIIWRRYGLASSFGAKFDRMSDDLLTLNAVGWLYLLRRELFVEYWPILAALLLAMFLSVALQTGASDAKWPSICTPARRPTGLSRCSRATRWSSGRWHGSST
jgi:hypothetical protein